MALFGGSRDISLFRHINRELMANIISQEIVFYKCNLVETKVNMYGEASSGRTFNKPVLFNALVEVNTSNLTQPIYITPSSEAIYQRAIVRSGQLPTDIINSKQVSALQLQFATNDVNSALLNGFSNVDLPNLSHRYTLTTKDLSLLHYDLKFGYSDL
jgi:hypothetical protein